VAGRFLVRRWSCRTGPAAGPGRQLQWPSRQAMSLPQKNVVVRCYWISSIRTPIKPPQD